MSHQEIIKIGDVSVPVIINKGETWYPITYIGEKVLLRKSRFIDKDTKQKYVKYIKQFKINFKKINNGGIQLTNCISETGLKEVLLNTQTGRHTIEKRKAQNLLMEHLGLNSLTERELIIGKINEEYINEYDEYTKDVVMTYIENNPHIKFQLCTHCKKYYPLATKFFGEHPKASTGYNKVCLICNKNTTRFAHDDKNLNRAYRDSGKELYKALKEDNLIQVYKKYLDGDLKHLPDCYNNKDDYLRIIKWLYKRDKINKYNLSSDMLTKKYKLIYLYKYLTMHNVYMYLFGEDFYFYPWEYPNYKFREIKLTYEIANQIFNLYLKENKISISDLFTFDYHDIVTKCKIRKLAERDLRYFAVQYNGFKYPGYKFKINGVNYYKNKENILFDLKYLIEQDLKLPIDKIPLYLTKNNLHKQCQSLYIAIVTNRNGSIYEWVNELYPEKFILQDFEINGYRNEFDSDTEAFIDDILKQEFKNVFYNQKHTDKTIKLDGMIPDWFIFTENRVWIIEYFGMYDKEHCYNQRIRDYIDKTEEKLRRYEYITGYNKIFLYIEDTKNNFSGVREKIKQMR